MKRVMSGRGAGEFRTEPIAGLKPRNWNSGLDQLTEKALLSHFASSLGAHGFHEQTCNEDKANNLRSQIGRRRNHAWVVVVSAKSAISSRKFPAFVA